MASSRILIDSIKAWNIQYPLFVLGPTGSGKTALVCHEISQRSLGSNVLLVSLDSVAVYQGLDIGSSKPLGWEREVAEWAGLDLCPPSQKLTVAGYIHLIQHQVQHALELSKPIIFVGGSHFYEKAIVDGLSLAGPSEPRFLESLKRTPLPALHQQLLAIAPKIAQKIHPQDEYRIFRALDVLVRQNLTEEQFLKPARSFLQNKPVETLILGLPQPADFESRLLIRIHQMLESGWIDETRALMTQFGPQAPALQTVGYREIVEYLMGKDFNLQKLEQSLVISHRQLAKKQRTWLRGLLSSKVVQPK